MKTVRLGRTGLEVSRVGLGGIPLTRPSAEAAADLVRRAVDLGVTLIDTAIGYQQSEERIGRGLHGIRHKVILATKTWAADRKLALQHLDTSLARLGTDYLDIWQFHGVTKVAEYEKIIGPGGALEAALEARQAGKIRFIGITSHSLDLAIRQVESGLFDTMQYQLNFISQEGAGRLVPLAAERDVGYLAMKPFAGGMIRNAGLAIKYLLRFPNVVPIPGVERPEEIEEIMGLAERDEPLTPEELAEIADIRSKTSDRFCRQCEYCMPCPQGVWVPGLMYVPKLWALWPRERVLSWGLVTGSIASAEKCTKCGECEEKCPYRLPIREMIDETLEFHAKAVKAGD